MIGYRLEEVSLGRHFVCMVIWLPRVSRHAKTIRKNEDNMKGVGEFIEIIAIQVGGELVKSATVCFSCSLNFEQTYLFRAEALDKSGKHGGDKVRQGVVGGGL